MYLNTVEYGSNAYGVKSAAQTFFNKEPHQLNVQEAAVLVGVVNAPTRTPCRRAACGSARGGAALPIFRCPRYYVSVDSSAYSYL